MVTRPIGYRAAHLRVEAARGHASAYACAGECGSPAVGWVYGGRDPDELTATVDGAVRYYSIDSDHYTALCRSCRIRHDRAQRALRTIATW